jgi:hypothetical protein
VAAANQSIQRIIEDIQRGHQVLSDFQRSFIWKRDDVRDLLISVLGDYYVGLNLQLIALLGYFWTDSSGRPPYSMLFMPKKTQPVACSTAIRRAGAMAWRANAIPSTPR